MPGLGCQICSSIELPPRSVVRFLFVNTEQKYRIAYKGFATNSEQASLQFRPTPSRSATIHL